MPTVEQRSAHADRPQVPSLRCSRRWEPAWESSSARAATSLGSVVPMTKPRHWPLSGSEAMPLNVLGMARRLWQNSASACVELLSIKPEARHTILCMLTVAEAADRVAKDPETVRRWIRSGRLRARRVGIRHAISDQDLLAVEDKLFPMAKLPDEWKLSDDGSPAPNWVAALHRSRRDH
jgi:excisionase family DNA binding protein